MELVYRHPSQIEARSIGDDLTLRLQVEQARYRDQRWITAHLEGEEGGEKVFSGLWSEGRKSQGIQGWLDGDYYDTLKTLRDGASTYEEGWARPVFQVLGTAVPLGGSFMVAYGMMTGESYLHRETKALLEGGVPPVLTPIGELLYQAGCGFGFKDWYIAEGGSEGPQKLQGYKPMDTHEAETRLEGLRREVEEFLDESAAEREGYERAEQWAEGLFGRMT